MDINLNKRSVLVVNRAWMVLGTVTIKQALIQMNSSSNGEPAGQGFDFEYEYLGDNMWNFDSPKNITPLNFEEWINLPIRPFDEVIHTSRLSIRIPNVVMAVNCDKSHLRHVTLSSKNIKERDGNVCQYTGIKLPAHMLNIDHVIPKSRGGKDTWENLVACDKRLNSIKGNKTPEEAGLKLIRKPKEPLPSTAASLIKEIRHREWEIFLRK